MISGASITRVMLYTKPAGYIRQCSTCACRIRTRASQIQARPSARSSSSNCRSSSSLRSTLSPLGYRSMGGDKYASDTRSPATRRWYGTSVDIRTSDLSKRKNNPDARTPTHTNFAISPRRSSSTKSDPARSNATIPKPKPVAAEEDEEFPLPLPRSLNPSRGLFLLSLPIPPEHWPSHLDMYSPLYRSCIKFFKTQGREVAVNCIYDNMGQEVEFPTPGVGGQGREEYRARLYLSGDKVLEWDRFSEEVLKSAEFGKEIDEALLSLRSGADGRKVKAEILVCTHGSRDCRCSDRGGGLVRSLREEIEDRGLEEEVQVSEIAHVGGHKYAANAILLPNLDMYSNLLPHDAPAFLDHITSLSLTNLEPKNQGQNPPANSQFWNHWRGRYGSSTQEQERFWASIDPTPPTQSDAPATAGPAGLGPTFPLRFRTFEGEERIVHAAIGETLLQVARREDLPSMEGSCGGNLECSTCHVYIPPSAPLAEPSDPELDMLGYALGYREESSRLGCQVKVSEELVRWCADGGEFGLPRY